MRYETFFFDTKGSCVEHSTDAPVFAVKAFERGYYPIYTRLNAEQLNKGAHSPEALEAALIGSLAGWNVPGAKAAVDEVQAAEKRLALESQ